MILKDKHGDSIEAVRRGDTALIVTKSTDGQLVIIELDDTQREALRQQLK